MRHPKKPLLSTAVLVASLIPSTSAYALSSATSPVTDVLYDGTLGTDPGSQSWLYCENTTPVSGSCRSDAPTSSNTAQESLYNASGNKGITFDTTATNNISAGFSNYGFSSTGVATLKNSQFPVLDENKGIVLNFTSQLVSESDTSSGTSGTNLRAGFSVIVVTNDLQAIEIGFQNNGTIFAQGENFNSPAQSSTTYNSSQLTNYSLVIAGNSFQLTGQPNGGGTVTSLLTGSLIPYYQSTSLSAVAKIPYSTPDFVFFGDDTTEGQAEVNLTNITLTANSTVPWEMPEGAAIPIASLAILGLMRNWRQKI